MSDQHPSEGRVVSESGAAGSDTRNEGTTASTAPGPTPAPSRRRLMDDPVSRRIMSIGLGLIVLFLASVVSALFFGLLNPTSPRTATERALNVYQTAIEAGNADPSIYAAYIRALTEAEQYNKAQEVINASEDATGFAKAQILVEQARLSNARGRNDEAVDAADQAIAQFITDRKALEETYTERGMPVPNDRPVEHRYALVIKARALTELDRIDDALAVYDEYLKIWPVDSDVRTLRGDLHAAKGNTKAAEKDYREALRFVPEYEPALEGLEKIGADR